MMSCRIRSAVSRLEYDIQAKLILSRRDQKKCAQAAAHHHACIASEYISRAARDRCMVYIERWEYYTITSVPMSSSRGMLARGWLQDTITSHVGLPQLAPPYGIMTYIPRAKLNGIPPFIPSRPTTRPFQSRFPVGNHRER